MAGPDSARSAAPWGGVLLLALSLALLGGAAWWFFLRPEEARERGFGDFRFDDPSRVYLGHARLARRPAVVDSSRVYAVIPEYTQVVSEGLDSDNPRYHFLMVEATKRFKQAVTEAANAAGHDVVAEAGTVHAVKADATEPPDLTDAVLGALR